MRKSKQFLSLFLAAILMLTLLPCIAAAKEDQLYAYPDYDPKIDRCYDYEVTVTQNEQTVPLTVYDCGNSATLLGARTRRPDLHRRFCEFAFLGSAVTVNIKVKRDFEFFSVIPGAKQFPVVCKDGVISVTVSNPDEVFAVRLNGDDNTILSVFADRPEDSSYAEASPSVLVIDTPWAEMSSGTTLVLDGKTSFEKSQKDGKTLLTPVSDTLHPATAVYVAPGCVLNARICTQAPGVKIYGHGAVLDPFSNLFAADIRTAESPFFILFGTPDCSISDIKLLDAQHYTLTLGWQCDRSVIAHIKILAATMCTDGISIFESKDVSASGNFLYPGDNAIVFGGNCDNCTFENTVIGTTCAAFFPQSSIPGTVTFRDSYVFRCDEGCVNNWYGATGDGASIENIVFDGLDCTDVTALPWLFHSQNQGSPQKKFTFRNTVINTPRGTAYLSVPANGTAVLLGNAAGETYPSGGYDLYFENLMIGGTPVRSKEELTCSMPEDAAQMHFSQLESSAINPLPVTVQANYNYPYKLLLGKSETFLPGCPQESGSELLLPAAILQKLALAKKISPVTVDGKDFVRLSDLQSAGVVAKYDRNAGVISMQDPACRTENLLAEKSDAFSRWTEMICYETDLSAAKEGSGIVYQTDVPSENSAAGMKCFVTDEIKRNGNSSYLLTFRAKTTAGAAQKANVTLGAFPSELGSIRKPVTISGMWSTYTFTFDLTQLDLDKVTDLYLSIGNNGTKDFSVQLTDLMLVDQNAPEEPAACDHTQSEQQPSCTADAVCSVCGATLSATGHSDKNGDGACDTCGAKFGESPAPACGHLCHAENGFSKLLWKIVNFFNRLFGINRYCPCGKAHY